MSAERLQIDAGQAQHRLVDHAEPGFHGRLGRACAAHAQVDGDIQHARAFGIIHAQEKNVAPAAVRQVHADRRGFAQDGEQAVRSGCEQFGPEAQRMVGRMAHAEHPLIAAHRAHAAAHLVGQRLKAEPVIGGGQRAGNGRAGAVGGLRRQEDFDRFFKPALQQVLVAAERNQRLRADARLERQVEAVDGVEEKQRAHAFVKIVAGAAEAVQGGAFVLQVRQRGGAAEGVQRAIAERRGRPR